MPQSNYQAALESVRAEHAAKRKAAYLAGMADTHEEKSVFHYEMFIEKYDEAGNLLYTPKMGKSGAKMFARHCANFKKMGYKVTVFYDPTEYLKSAREAALKAKLERSNIAAAAMLEEEKKKAEEAEKLKQAEEIIRQNEIDKAAAAKVAEMQKEKDDEIAKLRAELAASHEAAKSAQKTASKPVAGGDVPKAK